jgi:hypothetical protein
MSETPSAKRSRAFRKRMRDTLGEEGFKQYQNEIQRNRRAAKKNKIDNEPAAVEMTNLALELRAFIADIQKIKSGNSLPTPAVRAAPLKRQDDLLIKVDAADTNRLVENINAAVLKYKEKKPGAKRLPTPQTVQRYHDILKRLYREFRKDVFDDKGAKIDYSNYEWLANEDDTFKVWLEKKYPRVTSRSANVNAITSILRWLAGYEELYQRWSVINSSLANQRDNERKDNLARMNETVTRQLD